MALGAAASGLLSNVNLSVNPLQTVLGTYQAFSANRALKRLQRQAIPQYGITPEQTRSYNRAEEMSRTGFTGAERASAEQGFARQGNLAFRRALDLGGGSTARGIQGALGAMNLQGRNDFASADAGLRRRNIGYADQVGRGITDQRNRETQRAYNYRIMLEQNLGMAKKIGLENVVNSMQFGLGGRRGANGPSSSGGGGNYGGMYQVPSDQRNQIQPDNPYQGGFNFPPSNNYTWPQ